MADQETGRTMPQAFRWLALAFLCLIFLGLTSYFWFGILLLPRAFGAFGWAVAAAVILIFLGPLHLCARTFIIRPKRGLRIRGVEAWLLKLSVGLAPAVVAVVPVALPYVTREFGKFWISYIHLQEAGLPWLPIHLLASAILIPLVADPTRLRASVEGLMALRVRTALSSLYLGSCLLGLFGGFPGVFLSVFPLMSLLGEWMLWILVERAPGPKAPPSRWAPTWLTAIVVGFLLKVPLAGRVFARAPSGGGDCFVVGAAAAGHTAVVGSHYDTTHGNWVNAQWLRFKRFERVLQRSAPFLHRRLRAVYNRFAPSVARRIRFRLQADLLFLVLRPLELLAVLLAWLLDRVPGGFEPRSHGPEDRGAGVARQPGVSIDERTPSTRRVQR